MPGEAFELVERIGSGGMGAVWKARDTATGKFVAVKLLHDHLASDPAYVARLQDEVHNAQRVVSPHVVRVLGLGRRQRVPFMVMEYVDGESLRDRIRARGTLPWPEARAIAHKVALGLAAAHAAGVVHRDVKPGNVLLGKDGSVKIADFGISRALDRAAMAGSATGAGTPAYMAPEGGGSPLGDLYGLGCVLFEMLAGEPPFKADSQQAILLRHLRDLPDLSRLPEPARRITGWLLEKRPERRPPNAQVAAAALGGTAPPRPVRALRPVALVALAPIALAGAILAFVMIGNCGSGAKGGDQGTLIVVGAGSPGATQDENGSPVAGRSPRPGGAKATAPSSSPSPSASAGASTGPATDPSASVTPPIPSVTTTAGALPGQPTGLAFTASGAGLALHWNYDAAVPVTRFVVVTTWDSQVSPEEYAPAARSAAMSTKGDCRSVTVIAVNAAGQTPSAPLACPNQNTPVTPVTATVTPTSTTTPVVPPGSISSPPRVLP